MNMKNLTMWGIIALLVLGLFNLFQNPATITASKDLPFSTFIEELDKGNVISVDIKGNNIVGTFSNGSKFKTYSPNYPNLVEKLSSKGISFSAGPVEDKMPSFFSVLLSWFPMILLIAINNIIGNQDKRTLKKEGILSSTGPAEKEIPLDESFSTKFG